MNRYMLIHRLMGPAILLLLGIIALLNQAHLASWNLFVPLLLILIGMIKLAERFALSSAPYPQQYPGGPHQGPQYPGSSYPGSSYSGSSYSGQPYSGPAQQAVPQIPPANGSGSENEGGQS